MTRLKWLDNLQLENISPLLDECAGRAEAYELFHAMARFHQTLIAEIWLRWGLQPLTQPSTVSRPRAGSSIDPSAAIRALEEL